VLTAGGTSVRREYGRVNEDALLSPSGSGRVASVRKAKASVLESVGRVLSLGSPTQGATFEPTTPVLQTRRLSKAGEGQADVDLPTIVTDAYPSKRYVVHLRDQVFCPRCGTQGITLNGTSGFVDAPGSAKGDKKVRRRLARCRRYGAKVNPCKFECGGDKLKEFLDTAGVSSKVLGAKGRVLADPNVAPISKPLASAVERDPQCQVKIEAATFISSVARTIDNMGLKVTNSIAIADLKRGKVLQDTIEKSVGEAVSGSNDLITAKFNELASNLARRFQKVDKSAKEMSLSFEKQCKLSEDLQRTIEIAVKQMQSFIAVAETRYGRSACPVPALRRVVEGLSGSSCPNIGKDTPVLQPGVDAQVSSPDQAGRVSPMMVSSPAMQTCAQWPSIPNSSISRKELREQREKADYAAIAKSKRRVIADPKFAPASKPLSSAVECEPRSLAKIKADTFISSVARPIDNMQRRTSKYCTSTGKELGTETFFFIFCETMFEFC